MIQPMIPGALGEASKLHNIMLPFACNYCLSAWSDRICYPPLLLHRRTLDLCRKIRSGAATISVYMNDRVRCVY